MTDDDKRLDQFREAVLALAETHSISAEEMVGLGMTLVASYLPTQIADPDYRREVAHTILDGALDEIENIMFVDPESGAIN